MRITTIDHVDLRVSNVDVIELSQLTTSLDRLRSPRFRENVVSNPHGANAFVLTVTPASLHLIKRALKIMLRVVTPDKIAIET